MVLAMALLLHEHTAAISALVGGAICTIANGYAGWRIFATARPRTPQSELLGFYRAELGKLVTIVSLSVAYFAAAKQVDILAFVGAFLATLIAGTVAAASQEQTVTRAAVEATSEAE